MTFAIEILNLKIRLQQHNDASRGKASDMSEPLMTTRSDLFSCSLCLHTNKFKLSTFFSLRETSVLACKMSPFRFLSMALSSLITDAKRNDTLIDQLLRSTYKLNKPF